MGGKGGGGSSVAPYDQWVSNIARDPLTKQNYEKNRTKYGSEKDWYAAYGGGDPSPLMTPEMSNDIFTHIYGKYTEPPAAAAPQAAAPAAPAPAAPAPEAPAPQGAIGDPIGAGGAIDQPDSAGNLLGGAILDPPKYWVGDLDSMKAKPTNKTGDTSGALVTTQT